MTIPKVIHFTAPEDRSKWHPIWHKCYESWCDNHPDFDIKLWNDKEDLENIVKELEPQYLETFLDFPYKMMQLNFVRYILLYHFGGIFSDTDIFCYQKFYDDLANDTYILKNSFNETTVQHAPIENCLMVSSKGNEFFRNCIDRVIEKYNHFLPLFHKEKTIQPTWLNVNITSFPILLECRDPHNPNEYSLLDYSIYNNRASSYDKSFVTKHMRSSTWNRSVVPDQYFVIYNLMFSVSKKDESINRLISRADSLGLGYQIIDIKEFDFYKDYSNKSYFIGDESFDSEIKKKTKEIYQYMVSE